MKAKQDTLVGPPQVMQVLPWGSDAACMYIYMDRADVHTLCNLRFKPNISMLLRRVEARRRLEVTGAELAGGTELVGKAELDGDAQRVRVGAPWKAMTIVQDGNGHVTCEWKT